MTFAYCHREHLDVSEGIAGPGYVGESPLIPCLVVDTFRADETDDAPMVAAVEFLVGHAKRSALVPQGLLIDAQEFRLVEPHGDDTMDNHDKWRLLRLFDENVYGDHEITYIDPVDTGIGTN